AFSFCAEIEADDRTVETHGDGLRSGEVLPVALTEPRLGRCVQAIFVLDAVEALARLIDGELMIHAAVQDACGALVVARELAVREWPARFRNMVAHFEIDIVESRAETGPAPGSAAERTSRRDVKRRVVCCCENFRLGLANAALVRSPTCLEREHLQALTLAGECQRNSGRPRADDADVAGNALCGNFREHGHGRALPDHAYLRARTDWRFPSSRRLAL